MSEPKDAHQREQAAAALLEGMVQMATAAAAYFNRLVEDGLERHEALELTMCYITATCRGTIDDEDDIPGEDWKKKP